MNYKNIAIIGFILTCIAQLYIPAKMIWENEDVLQTGTVYKFRTAPVDPNDPFRGKYIVLNYRDNEFRVADMDVWEQNETVFVQLMADAEGFAQIGNVTKEAPESKDYVTAIIDHIEEPNGQATLIINFPFDRYYMEEFKAPDAEETYREATRDTSQVTYALVSVKNGEAVLKDVMIGGRSIKDWVAETTDQKKPPGE